jgi:uncharacterized membrane protein
MLQQRYTALMSQRLPEVDGLRGFALVLMVAFHFMVLLYVLGFGEAVIFEGFWLRVGQVSRHLFLFLVGVSVSLSSRGFDGQLLRALKIVAAALLVSFASGVVLGQEGMIRFGVLHLIACSVPLLALFKGKPFTALQAAFLTLCLAAPVDALVRPLLFSPFDYFPFFPWFGLMLLGLVFGELVYARRRPTPLAVFAWVPGLCLLGRHALLLYLLHFPLLYGLDCGCI